MIYISGKITDKNKEIEELNRKKFHEIERKFLIDGIKCFNPASFGHEESWETCLAKDLLWIYENRPKIYALKEWETSRGARLEIEFAKMIGLEVIYE
jgi:hypothetical protein